MGKVRILEIKESVFADNDRQADQTERKRCLPDESDVIAWLRQDDNSEKNDSSFKR